VGSGERGGRGAITGVDHAPVIGCFICPVLGAACSFIEGIAMLVDFMLRTGGDSCQSSKTEEETKHDRSDGDAEDCWADRGKGLILERCMF
jgi:hypothetical protein